MESFLKLPKYSERFGRWLRKKNKIIKDNNSSCTERERDRIRKLVLGVKWLHVYSLSTVLLTEREQ